MGRLIVLMCLISSAAFAARSITDIMYLPSKGTWASTTKYTSTTAEADVKNSPPATENTFSVISEEILYSTSNNLALSLGFDYTLSGENKTGGTYDYASGIDDVTIAARWRLKETDNSRMDIKISFSDSLGETETGTATVEGNNKAGGSSAKIAAEWGQSYGKNQSSLQIGIEKEAPTTTKNAVSGAVTSKTNSRLNYELLGTYQYGISDMNFLRANLSLKMLDDSLLAAAGSTPTEFKAPSYGLGLAYGHQLKKEGWLLSVGADYNTVDFEIAPTTEGSVNTMAYYVSLRGQF